MSSVTLGSSSIPVARHIHQGLVSQQERTLESQPVHLVIFTCKDTVAPVSVNYQLKMLNFKLYIYIKARLVQKHDKLAIFYNNHNRHRI